MIDIGTKDMDRIGGLLHCEFPIEKIEFDERNNVFRVICDGEVTIVSKERFEKLKEKNQ